MRVPASVAQTARRRGSALLIAVAALAIISALAAAIAWECVAARRVLDRRQTQLQAESLARAGVELAADRLLRDPAGYRGETVALVSGAEVRIEVRTDAKSGSVFRVTSEARYSADGGPRLVRSASRAFRRTSRNNEAHLEVVTEDR
jgi:hypothetical protein